MAKQKKSVRRARGMGGIIKRHGRFFFRMEIGGKRTEQGLNNEDGTPCTTREEATRAAVKVDRTLFDLDSEQKIVERLAHIQQLAVEYKASASDIWNLYVKSANRPDSSDKALKGQHVLLDRFGDWLKQKYSCGLDGTTAVTASEFMHELGETVSNRTFNGYLSILRVIFETVREQLGMKENPFGKIRRRSQEVISRKEFTEKQVQDIFAGFQTGFFYDKESKSVVDGKEVPGVQRMEFKPLFKDQMEVLLKLCCYTGCDGQSGCLMKWENVDLEANRIEYVRNKTKKKSGGKVIRLPFIHPALRDALLVAQQWRREDSPYILPDVADRYQRNHDGVQRDVMRIIQCTLGVDTTFQGDTGTRRAYAANQYSLHSFRHTFVSFCANAGVPMAIVAEIVGHGNPAMTRHYAHINDKAKMDAISVLPMLETHAVPTTESKEETVIIDTTAVESEQPAEVVTTSAEVSGDGLKRHADIPAHTHTLLCPV